MPAKFLHFKQKNNLRIKSAAFCFCFLGFSLLLIIHALSGSPPSKSIVNLESAAASVFVVFWCFRAGESPSKADSSRYAAIALPLLAAVPFFLTIKDPFLFDSYSHVVTASRESFQEVLRTAYVHPTGGDFFFRPFGYLNYWLEYRWAGYSSVMWHAGSLLLHIVAIYLLFILCRQLNLSRWGSSATCLFFGLHGTNAEVVSWTAAQFDELAVCFALATLILFCSYIEQAKTYGLMLVSCAFALSSKEAAFCLPGVAACCLWYRGTWSERALKGIAGITAICTMVLIYRFWVLGGIGGYRDTVGRPTILHFSIGRLLELIFFRMWSVLVFPINWSIKAEAWLIAAFSLFVLAAVAAILFSKPVARMILAAIVLAVIAVLPASHLALLDARLSGARVFHFAVLGMALLVGAIYEGFESRAAAVFVLSSLLLFQGAALTHNLLIWRDVSYLAQRTCSAFGQMTNTGEPVVVLPLPKMHNGVYFLSNGFGSCVYLNSGKQPTIFASPETNKGENVFTWDEVSKSIKRVQ